MKRLLLLGGGHAHLFVLEALCRRRCNAEVTLVSPDALTPYSGMLPGVVAGHYRYREACIALAPLAARAGVRLIAGRAASLDAGRRTVTLADGSRLDYDLLSLDTGAEAARPPLPGAADFTCPVKPVPALIDALEASAVERCAVIGAGAAGVEIALALRHRFPGARIALIERAARAMPGSPQGLVRRVEAELRRQEVTLRTDTPIHAFSAQGVILADGSTESSAFTVLCTGAAAPDWLQDSGLALDARGFVAIDETLCSLSHADVFAAGDLATVVANPRPRSGVFAVRAGPRLADNLMRALAGEAVQRWVPQRDALRLIACGRKHAIAARNGLSLQGDWVWRWKDRIDRAFIRRFDL